MNPEPSQGSHFFHNLSSFSVLYFTVPPRRRAGGRLGLAREPGGRGPHRARPARPHAERPSSCAWTGARAAASRRGRRAHEPAPRHAARPHPPRPAGAGQGAQLPLPRRRAAGPRGRAARRASSARWSARSPPAGSSPTCAWPASSSGTACSSRPASTPSPAAGWRRSLEAQGEIAGQIEVYYTEAMPRADEGPFLTEERKLLDAIAERIGHFVSRRRLQRVPGRRRRAEARPRRSGG